jgi:hypothetical protein
VGPFIGCFKDGDGTMPNIAVALWVRMANFLIIAFWAAL